MVEVRCVDLVLGIGDNRQLGVGVRPPVSIY